MKRVIGIGNALTDMLVNLRTDEVLTKYNLAKGSMSLVDTTLQTEISKSVAGLPYSLSLGGSAGNTIRAMARLGTEVGFIGKVGEDTTGDFYIQALTNLGIEPVVFQQHRHCNYNADGQAQYDDAVDKAVFLLFDFFHFFASM